MTTYPSGPCSTKRLKALALSNPAVRAEYERIEREEMPILDAILKARAGNGLTQAEVAARKAPKRPPWRGWKTRW
jgi:hypothetical protein